VIEPVAGPARLRVWCSPRCKAFSERLVSRLPEMRHHLEHTWPSLGRVSGKAAAMRSLRARIAKAEASRVGP